MTIEQTVEIPASRRLTIDVPPEIPEGRTRVIIQFPAVPQREEEPGEWVNPLLGLAAAKGSRLTVERFLEMQRQDLEHENEIDRRLWGDRRSGDEPE